MNETKFAIFLTLFACISQGKKNYSLVSIDKVIELLKRFHKVEVKRRWVFKCMRYMLDSGFLSRKSRYGHRDDGKIFQLSSIIAITVKGAKLLISKRVSGAFLLLKNIMAWVKKQDKRFPKTEDVMPIDPKDLDPEVLRRLENLAENVLKPI